MIRVQRASLVRPAGSAHVRRLGRGAEQSSNAAAHRQQDAENRRKEQCQRLLGATVRNNEDKVLVLAREELQGLLLTAVFALCHMLGVDSPPND